MHSVMVPRLHEKQEGEFTLNPFISSCVTPLPKGVSVPISILIYDS